MNKFFSHRGRRLAALALCLLLLTGLLAVNAAAIESAALKQVTADRKSTRLNSSHWS